MSDWTPTEALARANAGDSPDVEQYEPYESEQTSPVTAPSGWWVDMVNEIQWAMADRQFQDDLAELQETIERQLPEAYWNLDDFECTVQLTEAQNILLGDLLPFEDE